MLAFLFRQDCEDPIEEKILDLARFLKDDFEICVILLFSDQKAPDLVTELFASHGIKTYRIFTPEGFSFKTCRLIREVLSFLDVSLVHTHGVGADLFGRFLKSKNISWVSSIHSAESYEQLHQVKKAFYRWCLKDCDWMVFPTRHTQDKIGENFSKNKMSVIPWGVAKLPKTDFHNLKNVLFAGPLPVQTLNFSEGVKFLMPPEAHLIEFFQEVNIFVYTYQDSVVRKSLPLAMSAGCAIVALHSKAVSEYVADGDSALLVSKKDLYGLSVSIKKLMKDAALRQKLAVRVQQIYNEKFTLELMAEKYRILYRMFL